MLWSPLGHAFPILRFWVATEPLRTRILPRQHLRNHSHHDSNTTASCREQHQHFSHFALAFSLFSLARGQVPEHPPFCWPKRSRVHTRISAREDMFCFTKSRRFTTQLVGHQASSPAGGPHPAPREARRLRSFRSSAAFSSSGHFWLLVSVPNVPGGAQYDYEGCWDTSIPILRLAEVRLGCYCRSTNMGIGRKTGGHLVRG
jgi:hypothetical protein